MSIYGNGTDSERQNWADLKMSYHTIRPNRWTFQSKKVRRWVEARLSGRTLNACAGKTFLTHDGEILRNDINEERDADTHHDVTEIADHFEPESFDTIVFDPPFSNYQSNTKYDGEKVGNDTLAKKQFDELLAPGGTIIQFGFTTTCMPNSLPYEREEVAIWNTLGRMKDYLSVIDRKDGEPREQTGWF